MQSPWRLTATSADVRPAADPTGIGAREIAFWSVLIAASAFWMNIVRGADLAAPSAINAVIQSVLNNGAFDVFAWVMIFAGSTKMSAPGPASSAAICTAFLVGIIALAPARLGAALALLVLGCFLLMTPRVLAAGRKAALVMFALAFETIWTSPLLSPLHVLVGHLDARICAFLLSLLGGQAFVHANVVENVDNDFNISIWPYCASSFPLAGVALAFLVMTFYRGAEPRQRHVPWLLLSFIASIALTEVRLLLLATDEATYLWWHNGPGLSFYALGALALALVPPVLATRADGPCAA